MSEGRRIEDRQRAVHAMLRRRLESDPTSAPSGEGRIDVDEVAALLSGSLLPSELRLLENRILADERLRERIRALHDDYEAGAVPQLIRRVRTSRATRAPGAARFIRRQGPYWLALLVFVVVGALPFSFRACSRRVEREVKPASVVLESRGRPRVETADGEAVLFEGSVLGQGARIAFGRDDGVVLLTAGGSRRELDAEGERMVGTATGVLAGLFTATFVNHSARAGAQVPAGADADANPAGFVRPRGGILSARPEFAWSEVDGGPGYLLRILGSDGVEVLSQVVDTESVSFPRNAPALRRGGSYQAEVHSLRNPDGVVRTSFRIAEDSVLRDWEALRPRLAEIVGRSPSVLEAEWLANRDLDGEALTVLEGLKRDAPANVEILDRLRWICLRLGLDDRAAHFQSLRDRRR
ncbi:MAG: hypothetical protein R3F20_14820 [Planctomycetota bacterium]